METKSIIKYAILGMVVLVLFGLTGSVISTSNQEVELRNRFKQKMDERTAFYDKMWKTLSQKSQIAVKNDSSFARNVNAIMAGRKDAGQLFMKWVQESNPNANYQEVSALYADLSRAVEGQRDGFFMQEKMIQGIVLEHDNIMTRFPSGFILSNFTGRTRLTYKPITSDRTDNVIETGKDNDVNLF
jgi:hypothetical protein